jgi:ribonuclease-3
VAVTERLEAQERRVLTEFCKQYEVAFGDLDLLKLALTHRSYLSVTGQGPRESNERLEFLGDSVLGLVTSEFLYRRHPEEHEGQLTKTKSLLVSKAILSRRALKMGLGRYVLLSHSEVESGGRQRLSILADAFESVLGAIYLDQGFETARAFIHKHLLSDADSIVADKRHTNYKSHLQEYVQSTFRTHPVYRIRSEYGPDHSKHFMVEVMVGKRTLGEGRGHNKKEAEQAAARDALDRVEGVRRPGESEGGERRSRMGDEGPLRRPEERTPRRDAEADEATESERGRRRRERAEPSDVEEHSERRRSRRRARGGEAIPAPAPEPAPASEPEESWSVREAAEFEAEPSEDVFRPDAPGEEEGPEEGRGDVAPETGREPTRTHSATGHPAAGPAAAAPVAPIVATESGLAMAWGRGRRRPVSGARPGATPADEPAESVTLSEASLDPFMRVETSERTVVDLATVPEPVAPDDAAEEAAPSVEEDREARIDEIEQALASFGRRSQKLGRRGRRR